MREKKRGRPRLENRKKITVDQAVEITKEFWSQYNRPGYSKGYIYNLMCAGTLEKERHGKCVLLFEDEVREKLCG